MRRFISKLFFGVSGCIVLILLWFWFYVEQTFVLDPKTGKSFDIFGRELFEPPLIIHDIFEENFFPGYFWFFADWLGTVVLVCVAIFLFKLASKLDRKNENF